MKFKGNTEYKRDSYFSCRNFNRRFSIRPQREHLKRMNFRNCVLLQHCSASIKKKGVKD